MEAKSNLEFYPEPYPISPEDRAAIIAKLKAEFSAADLQRFTEEEEGVLFEDVLKELEAIEGQGSQGPK